MQVRLSESAAGPVVCPQQVTRRVRFRSLGGTVALRSHSSDISVLNGLVVWDGYGPAARLLPPTETVVDLGANTGLAARWMLAQWGPRRLLAIEPEPGNLLVLRENLDQPGTTVVPLAVGGDTRTARLTTTTGAFGFTLYGDDLAGSAGGVDVQLVPLPDVLEDAGAERIDLLKVDIEGAGRELFAACSGWIGRVRSLVVECHGSYTCEDLLADCARGGATFRAVDLDRKPTWGFEVITAVRVDA